MILFVFKNLNWTIDWAALDALHTAGGVILTWDRRVFEKLDSVVEVFQFQIY